MNEKLFMREAIKLAKKGIGSTSPNPAVGAVIVKNGRIVGRGYHKRAGLPHAEVCAIEDAGKNAKGGMLFVTLEPCAHYGRTPPCTSAIISAGIKEVFIGHIDPNPLVNGKGIEVLKRNGIKVHAGILEEECKELNRGYIKFMKTGLPFVTLKLAFTLNGKFYIPSMRYISSETALKYVHRLRAMNDAVLTGGGTIRIDNPRLSVRLVKGKEPVKVILTESLSIPQNSEVFKVKGEKVLFIPSGHAPKDEFKKIGAQIIEVERSPSGLSLKDVLKKLGEKKIMSVLVEGGEKLAENFIKENLVDRFIFIISPFIGGKGKSIFVNGEWMEELKLKKIMKKGRDFVIIGERCSQE